MSAVCVCVYTDYISVWVKVNERQAYAGGEQCVFMKYIQAQPEFVDSTPRVWTETFHRA